LPALDGCKADDSMTATLETWELLAKVAQAQTRVAVQADCTPDDALELMRQRAALTDRSVASIADAVNRHTMWFDQ
jgi:hypothetical protein